MYIFPCSNKVAQVLYGPCVFCIKYVHESIMHKVIIFCRFRAQKAEHRWGWRWSGRRPIHGSRPQRAPMYSSANPLEVSINFCMYMAALLLSSMSTKETLPCMILKAYIRAATITITNQRPFFFNKFNIAWCMKNLRTIYLRPNNIRVQFGISVMDLR